MKRSRSGKIVATLGPASSTMEQIEALFLAGADVFRLNFSHGEKPDHKARLDTIRAIEAKHNRPIGVLLDLQGPKLRVGTFKDGGTDLAKGARFRLDMEDKPGDGERVTLPHPEIFKALTPGAELLLDDGRIRLIAREVDGESAVTEVAVGGRLSDRKGVNVPNTVLPLSPLTPKDREDLGYGLELGVDWVALSFVQRPEDVEEARRLVDGQAAIMAKLEKPSAIQHLDDIIDAADGIMVARGDLGVELPPEDVPILQRRIVSTCRGAGKPVVVATQMLESMVKSPAPTRAEASDVATAVYEGADAVMLSAESAVGDYPVEAVNIMDRIIRRVEGDELFLDSRLGEHLPLEATTSDAISAAARQVANTIDARAIVTYTTSGSTTVRAARERPAARIICLTSKLTTARRMALVWGVHPVETSDVANFFEMVEKATASARDEGFAAVGERIVITAGVPFGTPGKTNILRIARVQE